MPRALRLQIVSRGGKKASLAQLFFVGAVVLCLSMFGLRENFNFNNCAKMFSARRFLRFKCAGFRLEIPPKSSFQQHSNAYKTSIMKNYKKYHLRKRSFGSVFSRANYGHEFSSEETHMYDKETSTQRHAETTPSTLALESEQSGSPSTSRSDFSDSSRSQDGASLSKRRRLSQQKTSSSTDITTARQNSDHTRREFAITSETSNPSSISDQSPRTIP
eukprot:684120_1